MRLDLLDKFAAELEARAKRLKSFVKYREPETRLVLFFALGRLTDKYAALSEELMKQARGAEASFFAGRAAFVRQVASAVFGEAPETDYNTGLYEVPEDLVTDTPQAELMRIAEFCVENVAPDEEVVQDAARLNAEIQRLLRKQKMLGVVGKCSEELLRAHKKAGKKADKLALVYELALLLENVQQTFSALRNLGGRRGRPAELAGFKV